MAKRYLTRKQLEGYIGKKGIKLSAEERGILRRAEKKAKIKRLSQEEFKTFAKLKRRTSLYSLNKLIPHSPKEEKIIGIINRTKVPEYTKEDYKKLLKRYRQFSVGGHMSFHGNKQIPIIVHGGETVLTAKVSDKIPKKYPIPKSVQKEIIKLNQKVVSVSAKEGGNVVKKDRQLREIERAFSKLNQPGMASHVRAIRKRLNIVRSKKRRKVDVYNNPQYLRTEIKTLKKLLPKLKKQGRILRKERKGFLDRDAKSVTGEGKKWHYNPIALKQQDKILGVKSKVLLPTENPLARSKIRSSSRISQEQRIKRIHNLKIKRTRSTELNKLFEGRISSKIKRKGKGVRSKAEAVKVKDFEFKKGGRINNKNNKTKGWYGDKRRHSLVAKKAWRKRRKRR